MGDGAEAASDPSHPAEQDLTGTVQRVTYVNEATGFCVLRVKARGHRRPVALVGHAAGIAAGETVTARGAWVRDPLHGLQFRAASLSSAISPDAGGIEACLGSGLLKGVGPLYARRLVAAFGERLFAVIEETPQRLCEVPGIGALRAQRIAADWAGQKAARDAMLFLQAQGIGAAPAARLVRRYGADTEALLRADPYRLMRDLPGFGFAAADAVARRLGIAPDAPLRLRAGIAHLLAEAAGEGDCAVPVAALAAGAAALLGLPEAAVEAALAVGAEQGEILLDGCDGALSAFAPDLHAAETLIAGRLRRLAAARPPWPEIDPADAIREVEHGLSLALSEGQRRAVATALGARLALVTGGPGVGKTVLIDVILRILRPRGVRALLAAPTGRAAKRLAESSGQEAKTLHRLLEFDPVEERFGRDEANPLDGDLLVIDEMSMVDVPLLAAALRALPDHAGLLLVGDADQLPPIGPGQPFADLLAAGTGAIARVAEIFRQAQGSRIVAAAHRIRKGELPEPLLSGDRGAPLSDFYFVPARSPRDAAEKIVEMAANRIPRRFRLDPLRDLQVLTPANEGPLGMRTLNLELQRALNDAAGPEVRRNGWAFRAGDRVMQTENDYDRDIFNGDLGIVVAADADAGALEVRFGGRLLSYEGDGLDRLGLAYASTIHKAQGAEFPAVLVPVMKLHGRMLNRNLIYTAATRGRSLVVLVGDPAALEAALARTLPRRRSRLRALLGAAP